MSPESVAEFLKSRAGLSKQAAYSDPVDEDVERALRSRGEDLIDIALAHYGRHMKVVSDLFLSAAPESPVRLACLSNRSLGRAILPSFPVGLLGRDSGPIADWLLSASAEELSALFENPTLSDDFLRDLLERKRGWEGLSEERLCRIVAILHRNQRMRTPRDDDWLDGWSEYTYEAVFDAAWRLAETAPTNRGWAYALGWLYEQLEPHAFSVKEPLKVAERWYVDPTDTEEAKREADSLAISFLGDWQRVRKGLGRLALGKRGTTERDLLSSDDVAFRCSAYSWGSLNAEQLWAGYERDGELAYSESVRNWFLWHRQETRQALEKMAWAVAKADKHSDLTAVNMYRSTERSTRQGHPTWFSDEEDVPGVDEGDQDREPATRGEIVALAAQAATKDDLVAIAAQIDRQAQELEALGRSIQEMSARTALSDRLGVQEMSSIAPDLSRQATLVEGVRQDLRTVMHRTGWIWWFSLGALFLAGLRYILVPK